MQEKIREIIIKKMNLTGASQDMQDKIIEESGLMIYQGALSRVMTDMNEENLNSLDAMLNSDSDPNMVFEYLIKNIPNFEDILGEEAEKIVSYMSKIDESIK